MSGRVTMLLTVLFLIVALGWGLHKLFMDVAIQFPPPLTIANGGTGCPHGTQLYGDLGRPGNIWSCELAEFVPDLPARIYTDSELVISDEPTSPQLITYSGAGALSVNTPSAVNCLYWNGTRVTFVLLANGRQIRVKCSNPDAVTAHGRQ